MRYTGGFTLLELLISISILSVLGLGAYQMLQTVVASNDRVRASSDGATDLNLAFSILQRDFNQFVPRPVRDRYGEPMAPLVFDNEDYVVEFTRGGWSNPAGRSRSRLQRVAYRIDYDEETLTRHFWEVLDRAEDSEPISQLLLEGVTDFRVTGLTDDFVSSLGSEPGQGKQAAPVGVEVVVAMEGAGEFERLFQLVDVFNPNDPGNRPGEGGDGPGPGENADKPALNSRKDD